MRLVVIAISILAGGVLVGCNGAPKVETARPPTTDGYGCVVPPPDVFTKVGLTIETANLNIGKLQANLGKVENRPEVQSLASQAATDERLLDYARCRALSVDNPSRMTPDQWTEFEDRARFARSNPTPADWQKFYDSRDPAKQQVDQSKVEVDRIKRVYDDFRNQHTVWVAQRDRIAAINQAQQAEYAHQLSTRLLYSGRIRKGERGPNFRMDIPRGSTLFFETSPRGVLRMRRDRPNGEDPLVYENVGNGDSRVTTWEPNCENCDWYFKQDAVEQMQIKVWMNGRPVLPDLQNTPPEPKLPTFN